MHIEFIVVFLHNCVIVTTLLDIIQNFTSYVYI